MNDIKMTLQDFNQMDARANETWRNTNQTARLFGNKSPLTAQELSAYSWLKASIEILVKRGLIPADTEVVLEVPDSEPLSED